MERTNLIKEIIENIPSNLETDLEKAYYIYVETCKIFKYDPRYNNSPFLLKQIILTSNQSIRNIKYEDIVCSTWSSIYVTLLRYINIPAKLVHRRGHFWVEFKANDLNMYCDPTYGRYSDLSRVKHNGMPAHFYAITNQKTDKIPIRDYRFNFDTILENINLKMGYVVKEDKIIDEIKSNINNYNTTYDKINYILSKLDLTNHDLIADYEYLINTIYLTMGSDRKNLVFNELTKIKEDLSIDVIKLITIKEDNKYRYLSFSSIDDINEVTKEDILEYANLGYGIDNHIFDIDINYPLKFEVPSTSINYFLNKISFINKIKENNKVR